MESAEVIALVKGHVEQELLLRNEYLAAENEILRSRIEGRLILTKAEKVRLARIGKDHYHKERAHQGLGNVAPAPEDTGPADGPVRCRERLGGLLRHYYRAAG